MAGNQTTVWTEASRPHQFSVRALLELLTLSSVVLAALQLHNLFAWTLGFALAAGWAIRVPVWRMRASLVMLFGGASGTLMGVLFVDCAFRLTSHVPWSNRLPDVLAFVGPICTLIGVFYVLFGFAHFVTALASLFESLVALWSTSARQQRPESNPVHPVHPVHPV